MNEYGEYHRAGQTPPFLNLPADASMPVWENERAMRLFSSMPETERRMVLEDLRGMSLREARSYADGLARIWLRQ